MRFSVEHHRHTLLRLHGAATVWLAIFMLVLQLLASSQHQHELSIDAADCASCLVAGHLPSDLPVAALPAVLPRAITLLYRLSESTGRVAITPTSLLIPDSQAPPSRRH